MRRALWLTLLVAGCSASSDPGLDAAMQVAGAQFVPGAMPEDTSGPVVLAMSLSRYTVEPGVRDQPLLGTLAETATGIAIGLDGDAGYWVVPADVPDTETPTLPSFVVELSFSTHAATGPQILVGRAVDRQGRFGPRREIALAITPPIVVTAPLVIALMWQRHADLDLHVVDPTGAEVWANKPSAYLPPAPPVTPDPSSVQSAGRLDFDSNAGCHIDGRNREQVIYATPPPEGRYVVRVDTFSLCGEVTASWRVEAYVDGALVGKASGASFVEDTRGEHGRGSGLTVLELDLP